MSLDNEGIEINLDTEIIHVVVAEINLDTRVTEINLGIDDATDVYVIAAGNVGPRGPIGPQGPQGLTGPMGPSGDAGTEAGFGFIEAKGDLIAGMADNAVDNLPVGSNGQVLKANSGATLGVEWGDPAVDLDDLTDVKTTTPNVPDDEDVLSWDADAGPGLWVPKPAVLDSDFHAAGDMIIGTDADQNDRLPIGLDGEVLTVDTSLPMKVKWGAGSGGAVLATIVDAKGDLIAATGPDVVERLPIGSDGQVLQADSGFDIGMKWANVANVPGSTFIVGSGVPSSSLGSVGDLYINKMTGLVYRKDSLGAASTSFRSGSFYDPTGPATTHNVPLPTGHTTGDQLIMWGVSVESLPDTPSGWSSRVGVYVDGHYWFCFTRTDNGSLGSSVAITSPVADYPLIGVAAYSGSTGVDAFVDGTTTGYQVATWPVPPIDTDVTNCLIVGLGVGSDQGYTVAQGAVSISSGWTKRVELHTGYLAARVVAMDKGAPSIGTQSGGSITLTTGTGSYWGHTFAVALKGTAGASGWTYIGNVVDESSVVDAKGDLIVATANDTIDRLAVGTNGQVLTADSSTTKGVRWGSASGSGGVTTYTRMPSTLSVTGTTETDIANFSVGAGDLSTDKMLRILLTGSALLVFQNMTVQIRVYVGGTKIFDDTSFVILVSGGQNRVWRLEMNHGMKGSATSARLYGRFAVAAGDAVTTGFGDLANVPQSGEFAANSTVDMSTAQTYRITATLTVNDPSNHAFTRLYGIVELV